MGGTIQTGGDIRPFETWRPPTVATTATQAGPSDGARVAGQSVDQKRGQPPVPTNSASSGNGMMGALGMMGAQMRGATDPKSTVDRELANRPGAKEAFEKLSPQDRQKFLSLARAHVPADLSGGGMKPGEKPTPAQFDKMMANGRDHAARGSLFTLMEQGKLTDRDSQGRTLLDNLGSMRTQQFAPGLDGKTVFSETVNTLANPDMLVHQGAKGTCTVTSLQHENVTKQPSEYARIMSGLTSPSGQVRLRNGQTMTRDEGLIADDQSGRSATNRIYQASMMEYANGALDYDNAADKHSKPGWRGYVQAGMEKVGLIDAKSGLNASQWQQALNGVMGQNYQARGYEGNPGRTEQELNKTITQRGAAPVALRWGTEADGKPSSHALMVEKMDSQYVYLRNPHGNFDMGNKGDIKDQPKREVVAQALPAGMGFGGGLGGMAVGGMAAGAMKPASGGTGNAPQMEFHGPSGGHIKMTRQEFYKHLQFYYVPGS